MMFKLNNRGITLIEIILVIALASIVLQVVLSIFIVGNNSFAVGNNKGFSQQGVRLASDFITNELKFSDNIFTQHSIDDGLITNGYYYLELTTNGDGSKKLSNYRVDKTGNTIMDKSINGNWESISIDNSRMGVIELNIKQVEGNSLKSGFELKSEMNLVNNQTLNSNINVLLGGENKLYYTLAEDNIVGTIDINVDGSEGPENPGEPENPDKPEDPDNQENPPDTNTYGPIIISDIMKIWYTDDNSTPIISNNKYILKIGREFKIKFKITGVSESYNVSVNDINIVPLESNMFEIATTPGTGNNEDFSIIIKVKDNKNNFSSNGVSKIFTFSKKNNP